MKTIAILLRNYIPFDDAITYVLKPTIIELSKENKIDIFCFQNSKSISSIEKLNNNIRLIRIDNTNKILNILKKIHLKFFNSDNNRMAFFKKYSNVVKTYFENEKYDLLISTSFPFCLHEIAYDLKRKNDFKWIAYEFDPYTMNNAINSNNAINHEINILKKSDYIFLPKENYDENIKNGFNELKDKYRIVDYPISNLINNNNIKNNIVYTGAFYEVIRDPIPILDIFNEVNLNYDIDIYYICNKKLNKRIIEKVKSIKPKINLYRNANKLECNKAIQKAKILLNIGNKTSNQTPSKVFEYISYGKPILNFYYDENDTSYKILKRYKLAINFKIGSDDINKIKESLQKDYENIDFSEIKKEFNIEINASKENAKFINKIMNN